MSNRVICPACGKLNRVSDDAVGTKIVCLACGARIAPEVRPKPEVDKPAPPAEHDLTDVPAAVSSPIARRAVQQRPLPLNKFVIVAATSLLLGAAIGSLLMLTRKPAAAPLANERQLLALKSEAEALAIAGKLEAAHAKYRELQDAGVGVQVKDSLNWDILDRAKVDQDRIMTLLLDKLQAANPPERAMPRPGTGTTTRADDPWYWPRVGTGGRVERPATDEATVEAVPPQDVPPPQAVAEAAPETGEAAEPAAEEVAVDEAPTTGPTGAGNAVARAPTPSRWVSDQAVTDDQIGFAIERGIDYLLSQIKDDQIAPIEGMTQTKYAGRNALVVYALLQAGRATNDKRLDPRGEFMGKIVDKMKSHELDRAGREPSQPVTYARSLRAAALAVYNRQQDREALTADADWLIKASVDGGYTYDDQFSSMETRRRVSLLRWDEFDDSAEECDGIHDGRRELITMRPQTQLKTPPPPKLGKSRSQERTAPPPGGRGQQRSTPIPMRPQGRIMMDPPPPRPFRPQAPTPLPDDGGEMIFPWDNSNSQYGLLGVWAAAETGVEVPRKYWEAVQNHWENWQFKTGEWGYMASDREGYLAMTCGGIASLWVTYDWLVAPKSKGQVGRETMSGNLRAGMKWLETADNGVNTPIPGKTHYPGYDLFGLERVGLASGLKYFGSHDWYRELAAKSVATQFPSGAWGREDGHPDGLIETAYQLLFLSHGRHPIFMNKLRFERGQGQKLDGKPLPAYWSNRPRDVANLARYASHEFERPLNWQVVDLTREWHDWLDCPVLFIASHNPPLLTDAECAKLRQFSEAGGIIFTHADAGTASFTKWVIEELVPRTFPGRNAEPLSVEHEIYSLHYNIPKPRPTLWGVSNGSRLLLVHSPTDLAAAWQQRNDRSNTSLFRLGIHMFLYVAGRADFRNRIDSPYVPPAPEGTSGTVGVARVKYEGEWDPEPGAWRRFANFYQWEMRTNVPVTPTDFADLDVKKTPVAHLTGNKAVKFTDAQAAALRTFVESGGIVLIDACGGSRDFDASVRDGLLPKAFPNAVPQAVPPTHPVLTADTPGAEPLALRLRPYAVDKLKMALPPLETIKAGKGEVILSHVDITTGLLGTKMLTVVGYDTPYAQAMVWNLLGWVAKNTPEQ